MKKSRLDKAIITSHNQAGGVTAHTVNVGQDSPVSRKPWWLERWSWIAGIIGTIIAIIGLWWTIFKDHQMKKSEGNEQQGGGVNVTSFNQSGGITAHTVNLGPGRRQIPPQLQDEMINYLADKPKGRVRIAVVESDQEAVALAGQIQSVLLRAGYTVDFQRFMMLSGPNGAPVGLIATIKDANAIPPHAQAVGDVLANAGLNPQPSVNSQWDSDVIHLVVGAKPIEK